MGLSYRTKLALDHTIGVAAALVFKAVARILAVFLRRDHGVPSAPKVVAVSKLVGLGSVVYSGVLCRGLKQKWPDAHLVYVTGRDCAELARRMPSVTEVLVLDDRSLVTLAASGAALVWRLWRLRPSLYFDLEVYSSFAAILASLSLATNRYGFYRRSAGFKRNLHTHVVFFNTRSHISDVYGQMLSCVEGGERPGLQGTLAVRAADREEARTVLEPHGWHGQTVVLLNPNASDLMLERRWPTAQWVRLITEAVQAHPDCLWALVGSKSEQSYVASIVSELPADTAARVVNLAGVVSLGGFIGLLDSCGLLITSDSGPLHLAVALGRPTVSLWGPGAPEHYMPVDGTHEVVYSKTYCSPCLYHADFPPCDGDNICMKQLPVEAVSSATTRIFQRLGGAESQRRRASDRGDVNVVQLDFAGSRPAIRHAPRR